MTEKRTVQSFEKKYFVLYNEGEIPGLQVHRCVTITEVVVNRQPNPLPGNVLSWS